MAGTPVNDSEPTWLHPEKLPPACWTLIHRLLAGGAAVAARSSVPSFWTPRTGAPAGLAPRSIHGFEKGPPGLDSKFSQTCEALASSVRMATTSVPSGSATALGSAAEALKGADGSRCAQPPKPAPAVVSTEDQMLP